MKLQRLCVLRNRSGEYLTPAGDLSKERRRAVIISIEQGNRVLTAAAGIWQRWHGLSTEELSKHARRHAAGLTAQQVDHLCMLLQIRRDGNAVARLRQEAAHHERMAQSCHEQIEAINKQTRERLEKLEKS